MKQKMDCLGEKNLPSVEIQNYISKNGGDFMEVAYELCFMSEKTGQNMIEILNNNNLSFNHDNFKIISKKMIEMDHFMDNPFEVIEGSENCGKCGSDRTITYSKQTRSSDEGATVFCKCVSCGHRAVFNS